MLKLILSTLFILITTHFLLSCQKPQTTPKDSVVIAINAIPPQLDPRLATDAVGMRLSNILFTGILRFNKDLKLEGELAKSWSYKNLTYKFELKPQLKFSDNSDVRARDIEWSINEFLKEGSAFADSFKVIDSYKVEYGPKNYYLEFKLKKFSSSFLSDLRVIKILRNDFLEKKIFSGPFIVESSDNKRIVLKSNSGFSFFKPHIKNVIFEIIRDDFTRYLKILNQEVDIIQNDMDFRRIAKLSTQKYLKVFHQTSLSMSYLLVNHTNEKLKNIESRKAIALTLQRENIIKYKFLNYAKLATSLIAPKHEMFNNEIFNFHQDIELAKKLAHESGLQTDNNHSSPLILKSTNNAQTVEILEVLANDLQQAQISVKAQVQDWGSLYEDIKSTKFDLALMKWVNLVDADIYRQALHTKETPPGRNRGQYSNSKLDSIVEQAREEENTQKRFELYKKAQQIAYDDFAVIPLWYDDDIAIVNSRVQNFQLYPTSDYYFLFDVFKED